MGRRQILTVAVLLACVSSTVSARDRLITLIPSPAPGQAMEQVNDRPAISSSGRNSGAALILNTVRINSRIGPVFVLAVKNAGGAEIDIDAAHVLVASDVGAPVLLTLETLQAIARAEVAGRRAGASSEMAMARLPGSRWMREDDKRMLADERVNAAQSAMGEAADLESGATRTADAIGFKRFKVAAGQTGFSPLALSPLSERASRLEVQVEVNGETHCFAYTLEHSSR